MCPSISGNLAPFGRGGVLSGFVSRYFHGRSTPGGPLTNEKGGMD